MKLAIIIAPFLLVGGYIAGDYYEEKKAASKNLFQMKVDGKCDIVSDKCTLKHEKLTLNLSDKNGFTQIDSNYALDSAGLSIIESSSKELQYPLTPDIGRTYWQASTELASLSETSPELKIRIIVTVNKGFYFSEFITSRSSN